MFKSLKAFYHNHRVWLYAKSREKDLRKAFNRRGKDDVMKEIRSDLNRVCFLPIEQYFTTITNKSLAICVMKITDNQLIKAYLNYKFSDPYTDVVFQMAEEPPRNFLTDIKPFNPHFGKMGISMWNLLDDIARAFRLHVEANDTIPVSFDDFVPYADHILLIAKIFKETSDPQIKDHYINIAAESRNVLLANALYKYASEPEKIYLKILFNDEIKETELCDCNGRPLRTGWIDK